MACFEERLDVREGAVPALIFCKPQLSLHMSEGPVSNTVTCSINTVLAAAIHAMKKLLPSPGLHDWLRTMLLWLHTL